MDKLMKYGLAALGLYFLYSMFKNSQTTINVSTAAPAGYQYSTDSFGNTILVQGLSPANQGYTYYTDSVGATTQVPALPGTSVPVPGTTIDRSGNIVPLATGF